VINPTNKTVSDETKQLIDKLLLERISWRGIARVTGVSWSWLQNYVNNKLASVPLLLRAGVNPEEIAASLGLSLEQVLEVARSPEDSDR
jgi:hypothetical protein